MLLFSDDNEYMSFGVSGDVGNSLMIGGDVVVAWVNRLTGKGYAQDYFLEAKSQCSGNRGSCPDTRLKDNSNSIRLLNAAIVNDYSIVTYQRPLKPADSYDRQIFLNGSQSSKINATKVYQVEKLILLTFSYLGNWTIEPEI